MDCCTKVLAIYVEPAFVCRKFLCFSYYHFIRCIVIPSYYSFFFIRSFPFLSVCRSVVIISESLAVFAHPRFVRSLILLAGLITLFTALLYYCFISLSRIFAFTDYGTKGLRIYVESSFVCLVFSMLFLLLPYSLLCIPPFFV